MHKNGQEPSVEDLAEELDMPQEKVREILKVAQEPISLESPIGEEEDRQLGDLDRKRDREAKRHDAWVDLRGGCEGRRKSSLVEFFFFSFGRVVQSGLV